MAQEENNKKVLEQEGLQIDPTKVTTEQRIPTAVDEQAIRNYDEQIRAIDLSDEAIAKAPSILALTQLGKRTTDNYLEQQKRHQKAGKFAAWSQFANALAAYAGGAYNGQAMPIQQNYNLPMSSFQKADAYRDAMAQNEERYAQARISAQQNEKARRLQHLNMLIDARQKAVEDAYKYGTTVKTERDDLTAAKTLNQMEANLRRANASERSAYAAERRAATSDERLKYEIEHGLVGGNKNYTPVLFLGDSINIPDSYKNFPITKYHIQALAKLANDSFKNGLDKLSAIGVNGKNRNVTDEQMDKAGLTKFEKNMIKEGQDNITSYFEFAYGTADLTNDSKAKIIDIITRGIDDKNVQSILNNATYSKKNGGSSASKEENNDSVYENVVG